jgi:hypothetical protein
MRQLVLFQVTPFSSLHTSRRLVAQPKLSR